MDQGEILDDWADEIGIKISPEVRPKLIALIEITQAHFGDEATRDDVLSEIADDLQTAISLINTDRSAAAVYLDRVQYGLSLSIPKPGNTLCLL